MTNLSAIRLPLRLKASGESFVLHDAAGQLLGAFYFDDGDDPVRKSVRQRIGREEARALAQVAARAIEDAARGGAG